MKYSSAIIRADFDRIAEHDADGWDHSTHYHPFLLAHLPDICQRSVEIGCGTGSFARLLARRSGAVLGIDLSPEMVRIARERSAGLPNIEYLADDVLTHPIPPESCDCIVSIATLHHLPMEEMLEKMKRSLRIGGVLMVLDLYEPEGLGDLLRSAAAVPVNIVLLLARNGRLRRTPEARRAWEEHARHDSYLTLSDVRGIASRVLPGAIIRRHLLWRYSIVWTRGLM